MYATNSVFVIPQYVTSFSTDVVFKSVRHNVRFAAALLFNKEEDMEFVFGVFCELFDFENIEINDFRDLVTYWSNDGDTTTVECSEWR